MKINNIDCCPFCGEPAKLIIVKGWYKVRCVNVSCAVRPCTRGCNEAGLAIELWNSRPDHKYNAMNQLHTEFSMTDWCEEMDILIAAANGDEPWCSKDRHIAPCRQDAALARTLEGLKHDYLLLVDEIREKAKI